MDKGKMQVRIGAKGELTIDGQGFKGEQCMTAFNRVFDGLGDITERKDKEERFESEFESEPEFA